MLYYKRHIGDYMRDASHLSLLEHGVYARLMDVFYGREKPIADADVMRFIGAKTKEEVAAVRSVLSDFWTLEADGWVQGRANHEMGKARDKADINRENGKKGGRPPKRREPHEEPKNNPMGFENETQSVSGRFESKTLSNYPINQLANNPTTPRVRSEDFAREDPNDYAAFERVKAAYPPFSANPSKWVLGQRNCQRLIEAGASWSELEGSARRFAAYVAAGGRSGPAFVDTPGNFFDPDNPERLWHQPWDPPASKAQTRQDANVAAGLAFLAEGKAP